MTIYEMTQVSLDSKTYVLPTIESCKTNNLHALECIARTWYLPSYELPLVTLKEIILSISDIP